MELEHIIDVRGVKSFTYCIDSSQRISKNLIQMSTHERGLTDVEGASAGLAVRVEAGGAAMVTIGDCS